MKGFRNKKGPTKQETGNALATLQNQVKAALAAQQFLVQQLQRLSGEYQNQARELDAMTNLVGSQQVEEITDNDVALINFCGILKEDGLPFEGGSSKKTAVRVGAGNFIPGFEEQLIGLKVGDLKQIDVKFPEDYHHEALRAQETTFHVQVVDVLRDRVSPEPFDVLAEELHEKKNAILKAELEAKRAAEAVEKGTDESQEEQQQEAKAD